MKDRALPFALAILFLALGSFVLHLPGIQSDEALFASVLHNPKVPPVQVRLVFGRFPAMAFPYIGTIKTGLFALQSQFVKPTPASVHFFQLLIGALTIYLFARLLQRLQQPLWAAALLATDATFLFTTRSDWGPVAIQHLLAIAGVTTAVRYAQTSALRWAAATGFLFGLGLWDKITFLWILVALAAGTLVAARHILNTKALAIGTFFMALGAYPLIVYNVKTHGATFSGHALLDTGPVWRKAELAWTCLGNGHIFGGDAPHWSIQPWLFLLALSLLCVPGYRKNPLFRFSLAALIAGYAAMFALVNSGSGPHHSVLLWPLPHILIALLPYPRYLLSAALLANLFQINAVYSQLRRHEVSVEWSDASTALALHIENDPRTYRVLEWGILDTLHLLNQGKNDLFLGPAPTPDDSLFISRPPHLSLLPIDPRQKLVPIHTIHDSAGRPIFLISRPAPIEGK